MAISAEDNDKVYEAVGRCAYLQINLDRITNNLNRIRSKIPLSTGIIGVVKGNAYGHGSVEVARHIKTLGVERLAVATVGEGVELRKAGIGGPLLVFGNANRVEARALFNHQLTPTVSSPEFAEAWAELAHNQTQVSGWRGEIEIEVNAGTNRNGIDVDHLDNFVNICSNLSIPIGGIYQHFSRGNSADDDNWTDQQLKSFMEVAAKYRMAGIPLHSSASCTAMKGIGADLDFVRIGKAMYGLDIPYLSEKEIASLGGASLAMSLIAKPTRVKMVSEGSYVGYGKRYRTSSAEIIGTFSLGYADGFGRFMNSTSSRAIRGSDGKYYPVVGESCMDATMVRLDSLEQVNDSFYLVTDDLDPATSEISQRNTSGNIILDYNTMRLARVYISGGVVKFIFGGL
ncbi:alanine racemase-like isoform X1 [Lineus longissimus]|uniref:alanine racemase-like isoform X1 n=1 Tax=Lineus longissimus TaxID=88925 RepID=UPI002B4EB202